MSKIKHNHLVNNRLLNNLRATMKRWTGKIAVVTGTSSGIGAIIAVKLVESGLIVIGLARRVELVEELKSKLPEELRSNLHPMKCDVAREEEIVQTFADIERKFGGVDILVNNAGIGRVTTLFESGNSVPLREILDTNVLGLVFCTREAVQSMRKRNVDGHIIHINSVVGQYVPHVPYYPTMNIYPASKHAVTALTETMRQDLNKLKLKIKVTSISPGIVKTERLAPTVDTHGTASLEPVDIADAVLYVLSTPPRVQVHELTIRPVGEAF